MKHLFILILCNYDGDSYSVWTSASLAESKFREEVEENDNTYHRIALLQVVAGEDFGAGSIGEWYAGQNGEVLFDKDFE